MERRECQRRWERSRPILGSWPPWLHQQVSEKFEWPFPTEPPRTDWRMRGTRCQKPAEIFRLPLPIGAARAEGLSRGGGVTMTSQHEFQFKESSGRRHRPAGSHPAKMGDPCGNPAVSIVGSFDWRHSGPRVKGRRGSIRAACQRPKGQADGGNAKKPETRHQYRELRAALGARPDMRPILRHPCEMQGFRLKEGRGMSHLQRSEPNPDPPASPPRTGPRAGAGWGDRCLLQDQLNATRNVRSESRTGRTDRPGPAREGGSQFSKERGRGRR